ncbi:MAG: radical SAM protein, partial [Atribacterota bacterium]
YPAVLPDGRTANLLKVLLSNHCIHNCYYCAHREGKAGGSSTRFVPEELARLFISLYQKGTVRGLFLSSAVDRNPFRTMEDMLKTTEILRRRYRFPGYIHLKILPESTPDYIETALHLATRVSINLEAPGPGYLKAIAPQKNFENIWRKFILLRDYSRRGLAPRAGFTTQLVVGGSDESDREIMQTISLLYQDFSMTRAYYSAFHPVPGTPLSEREPVSTWREHRLYQADFLLRRYGFQREELVFDGKGNLPVETDPKTLWASKHPELFPLEVNTASYSLLLRIPGIGPVCAKRITRARKETLLTTLESLQKIGVRTGHAAPFLLLAGKRIQKPEQLSLFGKRAEFAATG